VGSLSPMMPATARQIQFIHDSRPSAGPKKPASIALLPEGRVRLAESGRPLHEFQPCFKMPSSAA